MKETIEKLVSRHTFNLGRCKTLENYAEAENNFTNELLKAINYSQCCETLNLEVKPTFEEWLTTNFIKYDNEYYQDKNRNGIWKKHQLCKLYEEITNF